MKDLKAVFLTLVVVGFAASTAFAQVPPCNATPDNNLIPWSSSSPAGCFITTIKVDGVDCSVEICYCFRSWGTPVSHVDYNITRITILDAGCPTNAAPLGTVPALWAEAEKKLIELNRHGLVYGPCPDGGDFVSRFWKSSCWRRVVDNNTIVLEGCEGKADCYRNYRVCVDATGVHATLVAQGRLPGFVMCTSGCTDVCGD